MPAAPCAPSVAGARPGEKVKSDGCAGNASTAELSQIFLASNMAEPARKKAKAGPSDDPPNMAARATAFMAPFRVARPNTDSDTSDDEHSSFRCTRLRWEAKHAALVAGFETGLDELRQLHHELLVPFNALFRGGASQRSMEDELIQVHGLYQTVLHRMFCVHNELQHENPGMFFKDMEASDSEDLSLTDAELTVAPVPGSADPRIRRRNTDSGSADE